MQYILALAMIAILAGANSAVADNDVGNDDRSAQGRSISADVAELEKLGYDVSRLGKALTMAQDKLKAYGWQICVSASDRLGRPKVTYARSIQE